MKTYQFVRKNSGKKERPHIDHAFVAFTNALRKEMVEATSNLPVYPVQEDIEIVPPSHDELSASKVPTNPIKHVERLLIADFEVKPLFYMGVEFEGMIKEEIYELFEDSLSSLATTEDGDCLIQFGSDGSIKNVPNGYISVEIRTEVVRSKTGIRLFEEILCFLWIASQTGDWITNETCGLHINISEKNTFDAGKQVDYYCHVLSLFDEFGVLERFGRLENKYCRQFIKDNRDFKNVKHQFNLLKRRERAAADRGDDKWRVNEGKYLACSLRNSPEHDGYGGEEMEAHRIEFRAIGGSNYHLRLDDLDEVVNHIISCVRMAYREVNK